MRTCCSKTFPFLGIAGQDGGDDLCVNVAVKHFLSLVLQGRTGVMICACCSKTFPFLGIAGQDGGDDLCVNVAVKHFLSLVLQGRTGVMICAYMLQ